MAVDFKKTMCRAPLAIYVLYASENTFGYKVYEKIYHLLCRNSSRPFDDGLDIPVFFRTDINNTIRAIDTTFSHKTIVILLIDECMYCSHIWDGYIKYLLLKQTNNELKIFAVKLFKFAFDINPHLKQEQFICTKNDDIEKDWTEFQIRLFDNIIRYFHSNRIGQKLTLFISHSKKDKDNIGEITARSLRDYLRSDTKLDSFFDVNDILDGHEFAEQIQSKIAESLLVIIESDTYSEREWCRIEAISGKRNKVPSILVNLLNGVATRSFPYLGNMPKIRFNGNWDEVIILLLRTALNQYYEQIYLKQLVENCNLKNTSILPFPPELMNIINFESSTTSSILYPEPPLGSEELEILRTAGTISNFITPSQLYSCNNKLQGKKIAISISETTDSFYKGIGKVMFDDISVEIARHLLIAGAQLAYGGDLRAGGYTKLFSDLSCQYGIKEKSNNETKHLINYFAWPIYNKLSNSDISEFKYNRVDIIKTGIPKEVRDEDKVKFVAPNTSENMYLWAKALTIMRKEMEKNVDARIILGGRVSGFKGVMPGIFEEALYALKMKHPIYLLGGFGGAAAYIIELMNGQSSTDKLFEIAKSDASYMNLITYCQENYNQPISYKELKAFENHDYRILNNGLDQKDNDILFNSINITEIVSLILKGLNTVFEHRANVCNKFIHHLLRLFTSNV